MLHENIAREEAQLQKLARVGSPQAIQMLRQYAQTHQDDAIRLSLANQAVNDAKEMHSKALAMLSGQQPPTVAQQVVQSIGGQGGAPMPPPGGPQGPMPPQGMPMGMPPPGMQMPPPAPPAPQMPPPSGPSAAPQGLAGLPAQNIQHMADGGIAGYPDAGEAVGYADGGVPRYDGAETSVVRAPNISMTPTSERALTGQELWANQPPMYDYLMGDDSADAQEKAQRAKDRLAMGSGLGKAYAAAKDVLTLPGRGVAGAFETAVTRPLRAAGVPMPYLPESFYGGDRSSATPYMDAIRQQEQKAAASGQLPLPANVKPAQTQPVVKPAGEEAAAAVPAPPAQTYADLQKSISAGNAPAASRGAGAGVGAGRPPTLEIPKPLTVGEAQTRAGQFFDPKELYAQQDKIAAAARERQADTLSFARTNRPAAPFQELSKRLDTEEFNEVGEKEKAKGMALMMAGFKMMESPYGGKGLGSFLRNVGAGATVGAKELQQSNKEFKELAQKRLQLRTTIEAAQNAADRGDFERELALRTRGDDLNTSIDQNKQRIAEHAFGLTGNAALNAFEHAETRIFQARNTQFGADVQRDIAATNERGANARANAQIEAQKQAALFAASLPSAQTKYLGEIGGALPGTVPTSAQINAGLERINSVNDVETAMLTYEKLRNERAKMMASNPMVQLEPLPDQNTWLKQFMEQKRAYSLLNQGLYGGLKTTNNPGNAPTYAR